MIGSVRETYHESFVRLCIGSLSMAYRIFNYAPQDDEKEKTRKYCEKMKSKRKKKKFHLLINRLQTLFSASTIVEIMLS